MGQGAPARAGADGRMTAHVHVFRRLVAVLPGGVHVYATEGGGVTPCIEWQGPRDRQGYGRLSSMLAHGVAYAREHGPIPLSSAAPAMGRR